MIRYSVIIPVYNAQKHLRKCVDSLLRQTREYETEILLIDDGSGDESGIIADEYASVSPCVRSFHKENGGAASARNVGIKQARGEYLLFIDADDYVETALFESLEEAGRTYPSALIVYGMSFDYYHKDRLIRKETVSCAHSGVYKKEEVFRRCGAFFYDNALSSACNKAFRSDIIRQNGLFFREEMNLYEDLEFVLRYMSFTGELAFLNHPYYHYRNEPDLTHARRRASDIGRIKNNMEILLDTVVDIGGCAYQETMDVFASLYMDMFSRYLMSGMRSAGDIADAAPRYCGDEIFRLLLRQGAKLDRRSKGLLEMADDRKYRAIAYTFMKKRFRSGAVRKLKAFLNLLSGWKRRQ